MNPPFLLLVGALWSALALADPIITVTPEKTAP